jgi:hypothetical protein
MRFTTMFFEWKYKYKSSTSKAKAFNSHNVVARQSKVVNSCKNSHKWHIITCTCKFDGYKIQDLYCSYVILPITYLYMV